MANSSSRMCLFVSCWICGGFVRLNDARQHPTEKKTHPSWSNDPAEKSPWTPSALSRSYGHRRGWRLQVCIPFPWRLESTLVILGLSWSIGDGPWWIHTVQATSRWRPLGPRSFRPCFLSKVELEPVREMRALVDGFLLLAPCNSMGRLVQERLASLKFLESQKINKGVQSFYIPIMWYLRVIWCTCCYQYCMFQVLLQLWQNMMSPLIWHPCAHIRSETVIRHGLASKHANKQIGITLFGCCIDMPSPTRTLKPVFRQYTATKKGSCGPRGSRVHFSMFC